MTRALWFELAAVTLLVALAAAALPWSAGSLALSWDALNHHVYLGFIAESPRWELDVLAASGQGYQYPYLYWPVYRMLAHGGSGAVAGAAWAATQAALLVPPLWLIARSVVPSAPERIAAVLLGCLSVVLLVVVDSTGNDVIAALPLVWAVALGLAPVQGTGRSLACGSLFGLAVALKLSNGLMLPLLFFWWLGARHPHCGLSRGFALAGGAIGSFTIAYAPWGWQLWHYAGNPFHPYFADWFKG